MTRWFRPLKVHNYADHTLTLSSDNSIYQYWIEENYFSQLKATSARVLGESVSILFQCHDSTDPCIRPDFPPKKEPVRIKKEVSRVAPSSAPDSRGYLNPRSTFESFVVGVNNQFAAAAARAVAEAPARTYNPLFLHGSVGLGKTHLMQAIGHLIQKPTKSTSRFFTSPRSNSPTTTSARSSTVNWPGSARATGRSTCF